MRSTCSSSLSGAPLAPQPQFKRDGHPRQTSPKSCCPRLCRASRAEHCDGEPSQLWAWPSGAYRARP
eukprot:6560720-Pyramimonas_sp.AAC.1